jgi:hypothetical protein
MGAKLFSDIKERAYTEGVLEEGAKENNWGQER